MGGFSRVNINMSAVYLSHSQLHLSKPSHTYIQLFSAVNLSSRAPFALRQRVLIMPILCSRTNYTNVFYKETGTALNLSSLVSWEPTNFQSKINGKARQWIKKRPIRQGTCTLNTWRVSYCLWHFIQDAFQSCVQVMIVIVNAQSHTTV